MKFVVVSDIHGNMEALRAVIDASGAASADGVLCLGDIVGYGPEPGEAIETLRQLGARAVMGNHDAGAAGSDDAGTFNEMAAAALAWTREQLDEKERRYLERLKPRRKVSQALLAHAGPVDPLSWRYLFDPASAGEALKGIEETVCFVGHTHVPLIVERTGDEVSSLDGQDVTMRRGSRYLVNVGSVGQPRDGDPRACYGTYDSAARHVELHRVAYDAEKTRKMIIDAGLPRFLGERLLRGV